MSRLATSSDLAGMRWARGDGTAASSSTTVYGPFNQYHYTGNYVAGPWFTFKQPVTVVGVYVGDPYSGCTVTSGGWELEYFDGQRWQTAHSTPDRMRTKSGLSTAVSTQWRVLGGYIAATTHVSYDGIQLYIQEERNPRGFGMAAISLKATGTSRVPARHGGAAQARITWTATGRAQSVERAFHLTRQAPAVTPIHAGASNRVAIEFYLERIGGELTPARNPTGLAQVEPTRIATAFNGSRLWTARARLRVRLAMTGREGSQAWVQFGFELNNYGYLHTHLQSATMLASLRMEARNGLAVIHGEAAIMRVNIGLSGRYPPPQPDTPSEGPGGEVLPGYENRLRLHFDLWPRPRGIVVKQGQVRDAPIDLGIETEHRPYIRAQVEPLKISLLDGRVVQYYDRWDETWVSYIAPGWLGHVYPAAQLAVDFIEFSMIGVGVQTQYGEAALSMNFDTTASHYPWGQASITMVLAMRSKGVATYYGQHRSKVRLDYINFTGRPYSHGALRRPLAVKFDLLAGSLKDAVMGRAARQLVRLHFRPRGGYVVRMIEPRPVEIITVAEQPGVIHHRPHAEGI